MYEPGIDVLWPVVLLWLTAALTIAQALIAWLFLGPFPSNTNRASISVEFVKLALWLAVAIMALVQFQRQPRDTRIVA